MKIPTKIMIKEDGNILEYEGVALVKNKPVGHNYKYSKSETKKGEILFLTDAEIEMGLKRNIFTEVK